MTAIASTLILTLLLTGSGALSILLTYGLLTLILQRLAGRHVGGIFELTRI